MDTINIILAAINVITENVDTLGDAFAAALAAFAAFVGAVYSLFTLLAKLWDGVFGTSRGNDVIEKIGKFLRRFSLLKDDA